MFQLDMVAPPALDPVTLEEAKANLQVGHDLEDAIIGRAVGSAHMFIVSHRDVCLLETTYKLTTYAAPRLRLPKPPLVSVISVESGGKVLDADDYTVRPGTPGYLDLRHPCGGLVTITYKAGHATVEELNAGRLAAAREAVLLLVGHHFQNRQALTDSRTVQLPLGLRWQLDSIAPIA